MASAAQKDSPLSITASVAGILTFVAAIAATVYVRLTYLRNADSEYFTVKTSLSWYKTESTFLQDLIRSADRPVQKYDARESEMYSFVLEQLGKLEERLLDLLTEAEESAERGKKGKGRSGWTILPGGRTGIALTWLGVRTKALELVRQRDALGSRVLFAQMSMISSRVRDQEVKSRRREEKQCQRMERLEKMFFAQNEKLDKLEDLVYRVMHRDRIGFEGIELRREETPMYKEKSSAGNEDQSPPSELAAATLENLQNASTLDWTNPHFSISSV